MRVLVVEDEARMAGLLQRALREEGHAVDVAADGPEGLWLATENSYGAIVLDVMLPGLDGFQLCRRLRESGRWVPVLMLTAKDAVSNRVRGLDAGADDYLVQTEHGRMLSSNMLLPNLILLIDVTFSTPTGHSTR